MVYTAVLLTTQFFLGVTVNKNALPSFEAPVLIYQSHHVTSQNTWILSPQTVCAETERATADCCVAVAVAMVLRLNVRRLATEEQGTEIWPRIRECEVWCFLVCDAS